MHLCFESTIPVSHVQHHLMKQKLIEGIPFSKLTFEDTLLFSRITDLVTFGWHKLNFRYGASYVDVMLVILSGVQGVWCDSESAE